jgi:hypothetical protein
MASTWCCHCSSLLPFLFSFSFPFQFQLHLLLQFLCCISKYNCRKELHFIVLNFFKAKSKSTEQGKNSMIYFSHLGRVIISTDDSDWFYYLYFEGKKWKILLIADATTLSVDIWVRLRVEYRFSEFLSNGSTFVSQSE